MTMNKRRFGRDLKLDLLERKEEALEKKHAGESLVERPSAGRRRHGSRCQGAAAAAAELAGGEPRLVGRARETARGRPPSWPGLAWPWRHLAEGARVLDEVVVKGVLELGWPLVDGELIMFVSFPTDFGFSNAMLALYMCDYTRLCSRPAPGLLGQ
jgi:hypothetical protein